MENLKKMARMQGLLLDALDIDFSVCKVEDYSLVKFDHPFVFIGSTDREKSLVCPSDMVPGNVMVRDDGWKAFRIDGELDFSLIGILADITGILAKDHISVFAVSTYDTDYVLVKEENYHKALRILKQAGFCTKEQKKS